MEENQIEKRFEDHDEFEDMEFDLEEIEIEEEDEIVFTEEDIEKSIPMLELKTYIGNRNNEGERHGFGKAFYSNGDIYEGNYCNNLKHGYGRYVYNNGAEYIGKWRSGKKDGPGNLRYPDGSVYKGQFRENIRDGSGHYYYTNGDVYIGEWQNDQRHGYGTYRYSKTSAQYFGNWANDHMSGHGELVMGNFIFIGTFKNSRPMNGKFLFDNNTEQSGEFVPKNPDNPKSSLMWKGKKIQKASVKGGIIDMKKFDEKEYLLAAEREDYVFEPIISIEALSTIDSAVENDLKDEEKMKNYIENESQSEDFEPIKEEQKSI